MGGGEGGTIAWGAVLPRYIAKGDISRLNVYFAKGDISRLIFSHIAK